MAFFTGVVMGFLSLRVVPILAPVTVLLGGIIALVIYQFVEYSYFAGKRRGEFEYNYRESLMQQGIKGVLRSLPYRFEKDLAQVDPMALNPRLQEEAEREADPERRFYLYMSMGLRAVKSYYSSKALDAWVEAVRLKPHDLVANFRLAALWEYIGNGAEAIKGYQAALQDPDLDSDRLREFITSQLARVKARGPSKGSVHPAMSRILW
jgi:hypothetical protein